MSQAYFFVNNVTSLITSISLFFMSVKERDSYFDAKIQNWFAFGVEHIVFLLTTTYLSGSPFLVCYLDVLFYTVNSNHTIEKVFVFK